MLHILLLILKIIGIILGVLLGIVLLGIALVLFVPVRYRLEVSRTEGEGNPPAEVKAKITWLLHFVNIRIGYPSEVWLRIRLLFVTVFKLPKKKSERKGAGDAKRKKDTGAAKKKTTEARSEADKANAQQTEAAADTSETEAPETDIAETVTSKTKKKRKGLKFSVKGLWIKICKFFQNIWYTITGICDRIKIIWENIEYYLDILRSDTFKDSYALCKDELGAVFSYIKPRKFQADLVIGLGDPASTAKILSYYGILYPLVGNHVNIVPDFDEKRIEGTVFIKGKIKLFTFIKAAVRIYFNKDIKRLIKLFMKEDV